MAEPAADRNPSVNRFRRCPRPGRPGEAEKVVGLRKPGGLPGTGRLGDLARHPILARGNVRSKRRTDTVRAGTAGGTGAGRATGTPSRAYPGSQARGVTPSLRVRRQHRYRLGPPHHRPPSPRRLHHFARFPRGKKGKLRGVQGSASRGKPGRIGGRGGGRIPLPPLARSGAAAPSGAAPRGKVAGYPDTPPAVGPA